MQGNKTRGSSVLERRNEIAGVQGLRKERCNSNCFGVSAAEGTAKKRIGGEAAGVSSVR